MQPFGKTPVFTSLKRIFSVGIIEETDLKSIRTTRREKKIPLAPAFMIADQRDFQGAKCT